MTEPQTPDPSHSEPTEPFVRWSRPEAERGGTHLLVVLHGYGADENDLFGIVPELPEKFTIASVRAPLVMDHGGYTWFPLTNSLQSSPLAVRAAIEDLQEWVAAQRPDFASTSLLGFSMGMAMATSLLRREPQAYACVVGLSGFAIDPTMVPGAESATPEAGVVPSEVSGAGPLAGFFDDEAVKAVKPPVFWGRDQADPVITPDKIEYTHAWMNEHVNMTKVLYAGIGHGIGPQELRHVGEFLDYVVK
ncbi:alpha/beta hydrolase [Citricoccus sp. K5]|uniref:alpha/beta hydrolase n=1 Tax=Citricoccus sp. K5 TaxID=2653135 RepID=UPI0012F47429|nr:alpha/beta hydrolase-fold protein [Citricoccus sp. K5]VXB09366.1 Phospholipase/carboxylesterase [Citricoccus sp. K5]